MITLIQFPKSPNCPSYSPFCLKMETYLKVANVPYENKFTVSMTGSKKKKMPMILDQGELIEDSGLIIEHLKQKHGVDLDKHLAIEQKAIAKAFQWLCEKSLVDIVVHFRWVDQTNWPKFREVIFRGAPWFIKGTVANIMAKSIKKTLHKHGIGRFTDAEKLKILDDNLSAISSYLGTKKFFFGDQVSTIDVILYSFLVQVDPRGVVGQFEGVLNKYPNLTKYVDQFTKTYWSEAKS
ncbi:MAG: glutathione S-transferase family protein [Bdellovibrionales bacterium]|nr:glutathione S-transferase family protein [Bdellovibrionales bacterium]